jgi:beta-xylosidase
VRLVLDGTHVVTAPAIAGGPKPPYATSVPAQDCPDPGVIAIGTPPVYYAICTGGRFPIRRSHDLVMWETTGAFVFPSGKPPYAEHGNRNWAPEMHEVGGKFLVYCTSVNAANVLSIGVASAPEPTGRPLQLLRARGRYHHRCRCRLLAPRNPGRAAAHADVGSDVGSAVRPFLAWRA